MVRSTARHRPVPAPRRIRVIALASDRIEAAAAFWHRVWHQTFPDRIHPKPLADWRRRIRRFIREDHAAVVTRRGRIFAFLVYRDDGCIDQLWIDPDHQGQGIGTALIDLVERRTGHAAHLACWVVNRKALAFYRRRGFRIVGRKPHDYFPSTLLIMQRGPASTR